MLKLFCNPPRAMPYLAVRVSAAVALFSPWVIGSVNSLSRGGMVVFFGNIHRELRWVLENIRFEISSYAGTGCVENFFKIWYIDNSMLWIFR